MSITKPSKRIFGLDLLRALAVSLVLFSHTLELIIPEKWVPGLMKLTGFLGVELFFVLSGFLIGSILIKTVNKADYTINSIKKFWMRRWFRTLPNYYLFLIIYFIVYYFQHDHFLLSDWRYLSYFGFFQNVFTFHPNFFGVAWSLSVEEWFYILFPLFLLGFYKLGKGNSQYILRTIIFCLVIFLLVRIGFAWFVDMPWDKGFRKLLVLRLDAIAYGVLGAYFYLYKEDLWLKYKNAALFLGLLLLAAFCYFFWWDFHSNANDLLFSKTLLFSLLGLSILCLFPYFNALKNAKFGLWGRMVTWMSLISYTVYLAHPLLIASLVNFDVSWTLKFVLCWLLSIGVSSLVYLLYEKPTMQLRDRFYQGTYLAEVGDKP